MAGFEAKSAGDLATEHMKKLGIDWITFEGRRMPYRVPVKGEFYELIAAATREKVSQNDDVRELLLRTGDLKLRPDHHQAPDAPPAWRYHEILMRIRAELRGNSPRRMDRP